MYYVGMGKERSIVAERIEALLRIKDISVADLSRASGVSQSAISNILSGERRQPRSDTVQKIAMGFPTSTDYLNGYTNDWKPNDAPPLPDYAAEVVDFMRRLDRGRNYELLLIAQSFADANEEIRQLTRQELADMILDVGDELGSEEDTNRLMEVLRLLERRWSGLDDNPPLLSDDEPS